MTSFSATIYNTHLFEGTIPGISPSLRYKDTERRNALTNHLSKTSPCLIGLSEVWASQIEDDVINDLKPCGYEGYAYQLSPAAKLNPGLVTLAIGQLENPMGFSAYQNLVGWDSMAYKGVVFGTAKIAGQSIHIVQTHTQASYVGEEAKDEKAREDGITNILFPVLDNILQNTSNPVLLLGDLNIVANSKEYHGFNNQMRLRNMKDVWTTINPSDPGYTYVPSQNTLIQKFAPKDTQDQRLDYMYFLDTGTLSVKKAEVLKWKTPNGVDVSDHYGLHVEFSAP